MTHAYFYAHRLLPGLLLDNPSGFQQALIREGAPLLSRLWRHSAVHLGDAGPGDGLGFSIHTVSTRVEVTLIRLPLPQEPPEAYFVALARTTGEDEARVYTLELGGDANYLGGWTGSTHLNFGQGPEPDAQAFLQAVTRLCAG